QLALLHPARVTGPAKKLDWQSLSALHFEPPDRETFQALDLGFEVARRGGTCGAVLNAANEAAVERFLAGGLPFLDIARRCHAPGRVGSQAGRGPPPPVRPAPARPAPPPDRRPRSARPGPTARRPGRPDPGRSAPPRGW